MNARIGLIGSGYMATEYLKAASAVENLDIVSIYSRNIQTATSLAKNFNILTVASSVEDFAKLELDFLIICVPELATARIIYEFSRLNVPMLVEKPVGLTLTDALAIESFARDKELPIFAALNRRFYGVGKDLFKLMIKRIQLLQLLLVNQVKSLIIGCLLIQFT
jgi:predicted dehydrogenase